ncbi:DUF4123 domain-containing protein [Pseudomonas sp. NPDC077186]|uniref:DUF4123 domain-containing protein n=1 Tax=Pseudomonas sp. NPDC077186 TaxID=3364421 RepID=UPI0037CC11B3
MQSERLTTREWLDSIQLNQDTHLYVVMSNASDAAPLKAYYQDEQAASPSAIWSDTPYAEWWPVMPLLGALSMHSPFLDWIDQQSDEDWGWLAISPEPLETVLDHLRSLTQVRMPDGTEVFFRFWDGRQLLPILRHLGSEAGELLPVFEHYLINGQTLRAERPEIISSKTYPWWNVPSALLTALSQDDPSTLVDNLMQLLREDHPELYFAFPEANLRLKTEHFIRHATYTEDTLAGLFEAHLEKELAL